MGYFMSETVWTTGPPNAWPFWIGNLFLTRGLTGSLVSDKPLYWTSQSQWWFNDEHRTRKVLKWDDIIYNMWSLSPEMWIFTPKKYSRHGLKQHHQFEFIMRRSESCDSQIDIPKAWTNKLKIHRRGWLEHLQNILAMGKTSDSDHDSTMIGFLQSQPLVQIVWTLQIGPGSDSLHWGKTSPKAEGKKRKRDLGSEFSELSWYGCRMDMDMMSHGGFLKWGILSRHHGFWTTVTAWFGGTPMTSETSVDDDEWETQWIGLVGKIETGNHRFCHEKYVFFSCKKNPFNRSFLKNTYWEVS